MTQNSWSPSQRTQYAQLAARYGVVNAELHSAAAVSLLVLAAVIALLHAHFTEAVCLLGIAGIYTFGQASNRTGRVAQHQEHAWLAGAVCRALLHLGYASDWVACSAACSLLQQRGGHLAMVAVYTALGAYQQVSWERTHPPGPIIS